MHIFLNARRNQWVKLFGCQKPFHNSVPPMDPEKHKEGNTGELRLSLGTERRRQMTARQTPRARGTGLHTSATYAQEYPHQCRSHLMPGVRCGGCSARSLCTCSLEGWISARRSVSATLKGTAPPMARRVLGGRPTVRPVSSAVLRPTSLGPRDTCGEHGAAGAPGPVMLLPWEPGLGMTS